MATKLTHCSVKEASQQARVTQVYIRQLIAKGKLKASKNNQGRVRVDLASLNEYVAYRKRKEQRRNERIDNPESTRPSIASCDRIADQVRKDKVLSDTERQAFLSAIERYRAFYNATYDERQETRAKRSA